MVIVSIVVDPEFGCRLDAVAEKGPVWIADTPTNRPAAELWWLEHYPYSQPDRVTTFRVAPDASPEQWCLDVLPTVDLHFGAYDDRPPRYDVIEIRGTPPTAALRACLAENGYDQIIELTDGFRASRPERGH